ncbi:MAG: tryptophan-rich sensory protein [Planctomycetota bacterium]|jgi:hypothetical protein
MGKDTLRQVVVLLSIAGTIVFNILANALPLNGLRTGEISNRFEVYFVPAGYAFSIWGLIYLGLIAYGLFQSLPSQRENPRLRRAGYALAFTGIVNAAWLSCWHHERFVFSVAVMFLLLLTLIFIYLRLEVGRVRVGRIEQVCIHAPVSIYLGWITVATIANVSITLTHLAWDGWGLSPQAWTLVMLGVAVCIATGIAFSRGDAAFLLVLVWAFIGIAVRQAQTPLVAVGAVVAAALTGLLLVTSWCHQGNKKG